MKDNTSNHESKTLGSYKEFTSQPQKKSTSDLGN